jgi:hypothetical protein
VRLQLFGALRHYSDKDGLPASQQEVYQRAGAKVMYKLAIYTIVK